jgi:hypothetical protein
MMELFFNALWLLASVLAIVALLQSRGRLRQQKLLLCLASVLCAAAVLFPSISISDDIHVEAFAVEDSTPAKRVTRAIAQSTPITLAFWFGSAILLLVSVAPNWSVWLVTGRYPSSFEALLFIHDRMGRAPPSYLACCP